MHVPAGFPASAPARHDLIGPGSPQVAAAEAARHATGGTVLAGVAPEAGHVDLGGPVVPTWSYGGQIPGPEIRVRKGQVIQALLVNQLPAETTVHWHGVAIRNDMDGVPGMTQAPVAPGREFTYRFAVAEPGTYWYHPHVGVQLDRGLYGPLIVEDPGRARRLRPRLDGGPRRLDRRHRLHPGPGPGRPAPGHGRHVDGGRLPVAG